MKLIDRHKQLIAWYQKKLGLTDYGLLWLVFFKGVFLALVLERLIVHQMFNQDALLEYLSSPEGINTIIVGIILVAAINAIFITYNLRSTYRAAKIEREKLKIQQAKIDKLSPKEEQTICFFSNYGLRHRGIDVLI